jgi:hypothetical protein
VDGGAELDFDAGVDASGVRPSGVDASGRPVDEAAAIPDDLINFDLDEVDDPDATEADEADVYGEDLPDDLDEADEYEGAHGPGSLDDDEVEARRAGGRATPLDPDAAPWVVMDDEDVAEIARMKRIKEAMDDEVVPRDPREESRTDGMDATDTMMVEIDRTLDVVGYYADIERNRTPEERAELIKAAREVTFAQDMATPVPREVMAVLYPLAKVRGGGGFTRADAMEALAAQEITCNKTSVARWMRILTSQGHLDRERGAGPQGADVYRMGTQNRRQTG